MKNEILKRLKEMDNNVNRTAIRVGAVLFSLCATSFFCRSMLFVPVEDMIELTKIPSSSIDIAQIQRMIQQRADSQIGILLLVIGAMFSILSASLPVVFDDNMNWKGAIGIAIIVGVFLGASVYISSRLQQSAYKKAVDRIKFTVSETYPKSAEKLEIALSPALSKDRPNSSK